MLNEFWIVADNFKYINAWESIRIVQSMDNVCGSMSVKTTLYDPNNIFSIFVGLGSSYVAFINGFFVGNGYIESIPVTYNDRYESIEFHGRDRTSDLVDCSYAESTTGFSNLSVLQIISFLCLPYKITVTTDQSVSKEAAEIRKNFAVNQGDTVLSNIIRLCNDYGIMPLSFGDGNLTLTKGATKVTETILGDFNVKDGRINQNNTDRFSKYICKGQANGSDDVTVIDYIQPQNEYNDSVIKRYRPHVILSDIATDKGLCKQRAIFEANYRAGQSRSVEYTVEGWTLPTSQRPWKINELVIVNDTKLQVFRPLLISEVVFSYDEGSGFSTKLKLVHPSTYSTNLDIAQMNSKSDEKSANL